MTGSQTRLAGKRQKHRLGSGGGQEVKGDILAGEHVQNLI